MYIHIDKSVLSHLVHSNAPPSYTQLQIARSILSQTKEAIDKRVNQLLVLTRTSGEAELGSTSTRMYLSKEKDTAEECALQMQLILSPWRRLPPELLAEIFMFMLCETSSWYYHSFPEYAPQILLRVCHTWRALAFATPALWAKLSWEIYGQEDIDFIDTGGGQVSYPKAGSELMPLTGGTTRSLKRNV